MYEPIHEKITVTAQFATGKIVVESFVWKDKLHTVTETLLQVKARKGRELVWLIYVATKTAAFKLRFDTDLFQWWLEEYTWEEPNLR